MLIFHRKQKILHNIPKSLNKEYRKVDELEVKQMSLFDTVSDNDIVADIKNLDIGHMTPIDALNTLYKLQEKINNRW